MKLFEATWRENYQFFERYYDTNLKKSFKSEIKIPHEWYEESPNGIYEYILDSSIKLDKKQGRSKQGRDHYGFTDPMYRNIRDNYWGPNNLGKYNLKPNMWYLDIETRVNTCSSGFPVPEKALEPITSFQIYDTMTSTLIYLGLRDWKHEADYEFDFNVKHIKCKDEIHLIQTYISIFKKIDPLIIYAYNGAGFDFPYIYNRMKRLNLDPNELSNHGNVSYSESEYKGRKDFKVKADGHFYVDMEDVYRKFTFKPVPSYKLDVIAEIELKENKVAHTEYAAFDDFYTGKYIIPKKPIPKQKASKIYKEAVKGNWDEVKELAHSEFVYYGIKDSYLVKRIDEKKNFSVLMLMISEKMGVQIGDAMGTVKPWSQYLLNKSLLNMQVMPPRTEHDQPQVVGGYVQDPQKGKHDWVISSDVDSMYPLLGMVGFNMSPETFVPKHELPDTLKDIVLSHFNTQDEAARLDLDEDVWEAVTAELQKHNLSLGINGAVFSQDKIGIIPELVLDIYGTRKKAKTTMKKYEDRKILISEIIKANHEN